MSDAQGKESVLKVPKEQRYVSILKEEIKLMNNFKGQKGVLQIVKEYDDISKHFEYDASVAEELKDAKYAVKIELAVMSLQDFCFLTKYLEEPTAFIIFI